MPVKGWINDLFRVAWGFLYWNLRKSWYRWRGARGRCPCQNPSDSGAAHVTGCDAVNGWQSAARFRVVCPLLERSADGRWCCSVAAAQVRPFWGRAAGVAALTVLSVYLAGALTLFTGLRLRGYQIGFTRVFWLPTLRPELARARAALFLEKFRAAYGAGKVEEAMLDLAVAYQYQPDNYAVGMMLAQFRQAADPISADQIYGRLRAGHAERRTETSQVWFRSLLARGDFPAIIGLAKEELAETGEPPWLHGLLFAVRQTGDAAPLEALLAAPGKTPVDLREVMGIEAAVLRGRLAGEALHTKLLAEPPTPAGEYARYYRIERLVQGGWLPDALAAVNTARAQLSTRSFASLTLSILATAGDDATRVREIHALLSNTSSPNAALTDMLCAHLIRYPLPEAMKELTAAWRRDPATPSTERLPQALALYCAAAVSKNDQDLHDLGDWIRLVAGGHLPDALEPLAGILRGNGQNPRIKLLLPAIPAMDMDVVYALYSKR